MQGRRARHHIDKYLKKFLKDIFCVVGRNSPYQLNDFVHVLMDAVEHTNFANNTCVRTGGSTGETVFSRLQNADFEKIILPQVHDEAGDAPCGMPSRAFARKQMAIMPPAATELWFNVFQNRIYCESKKTAHEKSIAFLGVPAEHTTGQYQVTLESLRSASFVTFLPESVREFANANHRWKKQILNRTGKIEFSPISNFNP